MTPDKDDIEISEFDPDFIFDFPEANDKGIIGYSEDINLQMLYSAYKKGIFPWFEENSEPVLWWSPSPRFVLNIKDYHEPKSLSKFLKKTPYHYTIDKDYRSVMEQCAKMKRKDKKGTWIGQKMINAYCKLHAIGFAHSFEVWDEEENLVGGFYGVLMGKVFCGESMFTIKANSAKSAFALFVKAFREAGGCIIDCQVYTDNLARFGAKNISRDAFLKLESDYINIPLEKNLEETFKELVN